MRVLLANSMRGFGGGERWALEAADGLAGRGHEVSFAARAGGALAGRASAADHPVLSLPMSGDLDALSAARLAAWMRRRRVEVVCAGIQRAVRLSCAAAAAAGVRAVVERRGLALPVRPTRLNRLVYGRVTRVIVNCRALAADVAEVVPRERVTVIPNGIDPSRLRGGGAASFRAGLGISADAPVVGVVGRLTADKGHRDALAAFAVVRRAVPGARMLVVGAGRLEAELRREAGAAHPDGAVVFAGHVEDVGAAIAASSVLLVASLREGMPHVVLEAMSLGVPVVATAVAGVPEMIEDGRSGLLVPPGDPGLAARAVMRALADGVLARGLAGEAKRRVAAEFSLDAMVDRTEACLLAEAAAAGGGAGA